MQATTVISADRHERLRQFLKDLWDYRELAFSFLERDLRVRYKQTALGVVWIVLQPLFLTGAFVLIFGRIAKMPTDGLPPLLFYFAANVPWTAFSRAVTGAALSIEGNANLIAKVYFPRVAMPAALVCGSFVDFAIGMCLFHAVALWMGHWNWHLLGWMLPLMLIQACMALGIGLVLAAINAQYRDVKHVVHFLVQMMLLATPVIYPISSLPEIAQRLMFLNPMAAVVTTYRAALTGGPYDWELLGFSAVAAAIYLCAGVWYFRKRERRLADVL